ncbi:CRISPR-associated protein Cas2 [Thermoanaerobaculum aquaticum]|jgi:CRISPR-associated protein Cas2|uniref:CRISPR-associated protein Cas2 n=1 Tax=Thermoanaerobaculum aquaticum TaxID=1312852 RepID=A0A062XYU5_9BACT|nr:type I-E CRISPR-associated endoribonuclease Cas2e [Thermoanaerobaculum aquaticum]KDA53685.1 CRISPR-associated protein Cas2 [Thermoanaerobaculum aquaticum]BCW93357.1 MAG: type I-E CRISPR-associated endoribonuclease Cas2 [Thermoanaerobaculum sp.]GBC78904.1 CRISPR-associated endoribonuclease Cas2 [bacterium HR09]
MVVLILERVPKSLRGELTRWLLELDTGVFVGRVSALVRELLWEKVVEKAGGGRCAMAWGTNNEQGFALRLHGYVDRVPRDFDGLVLVAVRNSEAIRKKEKLQRLAQRSRSGGGG